MSAQNHAFSEKGSISGTLAIDLGNSTTVVAFQGELDTEPTLLDLTPISRVNGEVPSLVWYSAEGNPSLLVGQQVLNSNLIQQNNPNLSADFKRWIGAPIKGDHIKTKLSPERAGELLIAQIWDRLPPHLNVKRLVLTAPVETYRSYRTWLQQACSSIEVDELALVDEPTAAALGAGVAPGSTLLVIDIGGSTIDLSLVELQGGEGKAHPVAQLLKFQGKSLESKSKQVLRCAKVFGKAGLRLGGRDLDRWIANHLFPKMPLTEQLLNASEKLKCRLSNHNLEEYEVISELVEGTLQAENIYLKLNRSELEKLLIERGLLQCLSKLLKQTLESARANAFGLEDLTGVVLVGGGAHIPLVRRWLAEETKPAPLLTPPPIEAVAKGALSLTPGVTIKDVLQRGASLRCWDQKGKKHFWHPLFVAGQPWPSSRALEIVLAASQINQLEMELIIGEPDDLSTNEIIYINDIPTVTSNQSKIKTTKWQEMPYSLQLNPPGEPGKDCMKLKFSINKNCELEVEAIDLRSGEKLNKKTLGKIR